MHTGTAYHQHKPVEPRWDVAKEARDAEAADASARLHERIEEMFFRFERQHGLQRGEGQKLILDIGVRL